MLIELRCGETCEWREVGGDGHRGADVEVQAWVARAVDERDLCDGAVVVLHASRNTLNINAAHGCARRNSHDGRRRGSRWRRWSDGR